MFGNVITERYLYVTINYKVLTKVIKMEIKTIENGLKEPTGGWKYPFSAMKKGQVVTIQGTEEERERARNSVFVHQTRSAKKKFITRTDGDRLIVWRTK